MALASEGFSIREYAAKMRTVDVEKCWPFGRGSEGEIKKTDIEAFLPPISVTKFRWWSHELEGSLKSSRTHEEWAPVSRAEVEFPRSGSEFHAQKAEHEKSVMEEQKLDMVCPVCRLFTAGTVNAVNAHMDSCLAQPSKTVLRRQMKKQAMKTKAFREPKKRSIAEIFAVAPPIESTDVDDEIADGDCNSKEDKFGSCKVSSWAKVVSTINCNKNRKMKMKRSKKKKKGRVMEENRIAIARKMKQNMTKFKKVTMKDGSIAKKERLHKLKLPPAVDFTRKLNGSVCNKRFSEDILNATSVRGKKPSLRGLSMQKKLKVVQTSKLIVKPQMPVLPVRSILKNHKNALFGLNSAICSLQCSSQKNHSRIQRSDRHVRFSDKDVILGPAQKHTSDAFEHSNGKLFSDAFAASSEKYPATEHDKEVAPMEVDRTDGGVFISTNNGSDVRVITGRENLLNTHSNGDPQRSLRQHVTFLDKIKHFPENSVCLRQAVIHDDNEHMFDQGHLTMSNKPAYTGIPSLISATEGRCNPCVNAQVGGDVMRAFNQSGKLAFLDTNRGVPATCSMAFIGASSPPSTSCAASDENANRRLPFLSQSATETFNGRILQYQPLCHASPKVLMNSMRSLPEWKQRAVLREKYPDDGFLGLPLNSQGELIQFSSSGKGAFDQLMLPSAMTCSSSTLAVHNLTTPQCTREYVSVEKSHTGEGELSRDLLNLFPVQNYVMGNPKVHLPAIFGVTELEGTERSDLHWLNSVRGTNHLVRPLDSHLHWSFNGCGQYDQVQNKSTTQAKLVPQTTKIIVRRGSPLINRLEICHESYITINCRFLVSKISLALRVIFFLCEDFDPCCYSKRHIMTIRTVKVSNVSLRASEQDMKEFFSFSGQIAYVEMRSEDKSSQVAYITFRESQGAETAVLLSGATIVDQPVTIALAPEYELPAAAASAPLTGTEDKSAGGSESAIQKAEDVVSSMLAKGFNLGKDALNKAKTFDEKHQFTSTATAKIASLDQKIGLTEKVSAGTTLVTDKAREMDEKFQVSEKTKTAISAAEQTVNSAGSAIMKNRYVLTGASWVTGAFNKVTKAAGEVGQKAKETVLAGEDQGKKVEESSQTLESDSPAAATIEQTSKPAPAQELIL